MLRDPFATLAEGSPTVKYPRLLLIVIVLFLAGCARSIAPPASAPLPVDQLTAGLSVPPGDPVLEIPDETDAGGGEGETPVDTPTTEAPDESADDGADASEPGAGEPTAEPVATPVENIIYTVETGDILSLIAERFDVSMADIIAANNLVNADRLEVGQELLIPLAGLDAVTPPTADPAATATPATTGDTIHIVRAGENLFRIGLLYGIPYQELAAYNNIADPTQISVGQEIRIPSR